MQRQVEPEDRASELFFQLASMDRRRILSEFEKENLSLTEAARHLDMTATETLRQLHRMTEAGLLERTPDGKYRVTAYAKLVHDTSSSLDFVSKNREFFLEHDASLLPNEFRSRLGELSGGTVISSTIESLNKVTVMLRSAREKVDATVELGFDVHLEIMNQRLADGLKIRWLAAESFLPKATAILHSGKHLPETRSTPRLPGHIYVTDKAAAISLRRNDGTMGYTAMYGEDPSFLRWADGLYRHEWQKASPW